MDKEMYEHTIPLMLLSFLGTWIVAEYFFTPLESLIPITDTIRVYTTILASAAWGLGIAILTLSHVKKLYTQSQDPHWGFSAIYIVSFVGMCIAGLMGGTQGVNFLWAYDNIFAPGGMALYSTTAFFITTAAFRVFRVRNIDSTVLLVSGSVVLMSVLPIFTGIFPPISGMGAWIMTVPGVAGYRAFTIGVALGIIGLGIRIFLHKHPEVLK